MSHSKSLEHTRFQWKIKNFCSCLTYPSKFTSQTFQLAHSSSDWHIELSSGYIENMQVRISTHLCRNDPDEGSEEIQVRFSLSLRSTDYEISDLVAEDLLFTFKRGSRYGAYCNLKFPIKLTYNNYINDTLTVICEMFSVVDGESRNLMTDINADLDILSRDLMNLFNSDTAGNATLVVGGLEIPVHKEILSSRSSVLSNIFATGLSRVHIPIYSKEVVTAMLGFIYSGDLSCMFKEFEGNPPPIEIYDCAKYYGIAHLQEVLELQEIHAHTHIQTLDYFGCMIPVYKAFGTNYHTQQTEEHRCGHILIQLSIDRDIQLGNIILSVCLRNLLGVISTLMDISIAGADGGKCIAETYLLYSNDLRCFCRIIIPEELIRKEFSNSSNQTLKIRFFFKFLLTDHDTFYSDIAYSPKPIARNGTFSFNSLSIQMRELHRTRSHADAAIKVGSTIIDVHKSVLSARSPLFRKLLEQNRKYVITDLSLSVVKLLLFYVYSGYLYKTTPVSLIRLYSAAAKFEIPQLQEACLDSIKRSHLKPFNVIRICMFAHLKNLQELKIRCMRYISENADIIVVKRSWFNLINVNGALHSEILQFINMNRNILRLFN